MEHIIISPGKLKLMLTKSDLDRYALDASSMDSEDTLTRQAFRTLLADVKRVSGFDTSNDKVFIQLYPSRDGGAEMYITRLTTPQQSTHTDAAVKITGVYRFASLSIMLEACSKIREEIMPDTSSVWYAGREYYLITEECLSYKEFVDTKNKSGLGDLLGAYSRVMTSPIAIAYVREHCRCVVERDAVRLLSELS